MRPSARRLVRVVQRSQLPAPTLVAEHSLSNIQSKGKVEVVPFLPPSARLEERVTLMDTLKRRKEAAGERYPSNIRLEPLVDKRVFKPLAKEHRTALKEMLRER